MSKPIRLVDSLDLATLRSHDGFLRALARGLLIGDVDADDVVQDTWLSALKNEGAVRRPRAWLARVTRRRAIDRIRREHTRAGYETSTPGPQPVLSPAVIAEREELRARLVARVLALPQPLREAILLRHYNGLAPRSAAEVAGVPLETFRTRLKRGYARLREQFLRDEPDRRWVSGLSALGNVSLVTPALSLGMCAVLFGLITTLGLVIGYLLVHRNTVTTPDEASIREASADRGAVPDRGPMLTPAVLQQQRAVKSSPPQTRKGCWLVGRVKSAVGFGNTPVTLRVRDPRQPERHALTSLSNIDGSVSIDVTSLFPQSDPRRSLLQLLVELDHPLHMRASVNVEVSRQARRVGRYREGHATLALEAKLEAASRWVRGVVTPPPGIAPADLRVALLRWDVDGDRPYPCASDHASPNDDGSYELRSTTGGRHAVVAWPVPSTTSACLPGHIYVDIGQPNIEAPPFVLEAGDVVDGRVVTRGELQDGARLHLEATPRGTGGMACSDPVPLKWQHDLFHMKYRVVLTRRNGSFEIAGFHHGPINLRLKQDVSWNDAVLPTYRDDDVELPEWSIHVPSANHELEVPLELWLLQVDFDGMGYRRLGVHCEGSTFGMHDVDAKGRTANFAQGNGSVREHAFLAGELGVVKATVRPGQWSHVRFRRADDLGSLNIELDENAASKSDLFRLYLRDASPNGRNWLMRMPSYEAVRHGTTLSYANVTPGTWTGELVPCFGRGAEWNSFLCATFFDVDVPGGETARVQVTLPEGGYVRIENLHAIAHALGIRGTRWAPGNLLRLRILDDQGKSQKVRYESTDPKRTLEPYGWPRRLDRPVTRHRNGRFWPALQPGTYRLEIRRPKPQSKTPRVWATDDIRLRNEELQDTKPRYVPFSVAKGTWTVITRDHVAR